MHTNPENPSAPTEDAATNRVSGNKGKAPKPSFSQFGHWVWMNRTLTDAGYRYYSAVRSYIFDADDEFEVDLTDEMIAELLGKSSKSIARARRDCYKAGVIEELATWKESVRVEGKARPEVRTFRQLVVHHEVPEGYEGPINAYAEKRAIERRRTQEQKDARAEREQARQAARETRTQHREQCEGTDLSGHIAQGVSDRSSESPAQCEGTNLSEVETNLSEVETNLSTTTGGDQGKQVPYLPSHLPSHQPTRANADETAVQAGSMVGWSSDEEATTVADTAGGVLLQSYGLVGSKLREWAPVVDEALESLGQKRVERVLVGGTSQPGTGAIVSTRLPSLQGQLSRSAQQQTPSRRVPWCGQCDYPETRQVEDDRDRPQPCPRCHPRYVTEP